MRWNTEMDAFGYSDPDHIQASPAAFQVVEGKGADTLEPAVILLVRFFLNEKEDTFAYIELDAADDHPGMTKQLGLPMPPDMADALADQLREMAELARRRSIEG